MTNYDGFMQIDVKSSMIETLKYSNSTKVLKVLFCNGDEYAYDGVPFETVEKMSTADSVGKYFNEHVKGHYETHQLMEAD